MIANDSQYTVGEIVRLAGLTVRTLHHYDEIGLVRPSGRSEAGYRLCGQSELERLQEVLFFRELGVPLERIAEFLAGADYERGAALVRHRELLSERVERLNRLIDAVDVAIEARRTGMTLSKEEMLEVFDGFDPSEHAAEAEERWGKTDAYAESSRRTKGYTKDDWAAIKADVNEMYAAFVELMEAGVAADSEEAMALAERHRAHITKWFYDCSVEIHAGLGQMYVQDERFRASIDEAGEGLAECMSEAIAENAAR